MDVDLESQRMPLWSAESKKPSERARERERERQRARERERERWRERERAKETPEKERGGRETEQRHPQSPAHLAEAVRGGVKVICRIRPFVEDDARKPSRWKKT